MKQWLTFGLNTRLIVPQLDTSKQNENEKQNITAQLKYTQLIEKSYCGS